MERKIVIAGGTGFIGNYMKEHFAALGYQVLIISRERGHILWENEKWMVDALEGAEMVVNLAGKSVDCRYNERNKREILRSRLETTKMLGRAILKCNLAPKLWLNSSTATIYRHALDRPMGERDGEIGSGFSVDVATQWEQSFFDFQLADTRQVALRMTIVLGKNGGVIRPLVNLVRFGLGGKQGNGKQMFSWIHIEDLFGIIRFLHSHEELAGVFNCASPYPVTNEVLMKSLRQSLGAKIGIAQPVWLLRIGALLINTETELILKSRWVVPDRLLQLGFEFKYPTIDKALKNILVEK